MISVYQSLYSLAKEVGRFSAAAGIVVEPANGQYFAMSGNCFTLKKTQMAKNHPQTAFYQANFNFQVVSCRV